MSVFRDRELVEHQNCGMNGRPRVVEDNDSKLTEPSSDELFDVEFEIVQAGGDSERVVLARGELADWHVTRRMAEMLFVLHEQEVRVQCVKIVVVDFYETLKVKFK